MNQTLRSCFAVKRDNACVGCGLNDPGFEFGHWQQVFLFSETSGSAVGPTEVFIEWVPGFFPGGLAAGACSWRLPFCSAEVKNE